MWLPRGQSGSGAWSGGARAGECTPHDGAEDTKVTPDSECPQVSEACTHRCFRMTGGGSSKGESKGGGQPAGGRTKSIS